MLQYSKEIKRIENFDVVVCGGGCAGVVAAIAAARQGVTVALIEKSQTVGGTATTSLVGPFMTSFDGKGKKQIVKGIFDEIVVRLEKLKGGIHPSKTGDGSPYGCYYKGEDRRHNNVAPFDSSALSLVMFEMLKENGVVIFTNTSLVDAIVYNGVLNTAVCFDSSDFRAFQAKNFLDTTGDGLLSLKAGVEMLKGREADNKTQPMSLFFSVYGVDDDAIDKYILDHEDERGMLFNAYIQKAMQAGNYPIPRDKIGLYKLLKNGEWMLNTTRMQDLDPTVNEDLGEAYYNGLKQIFFLLDFFKQLPGMSNARLKAIASTVGIRESRRIKGAYTLTADDLVNATPFDDSVALGSFCMDIHPPEGAKAGINHEKSGVANYYRIPFRIMLPEKLDGLIVAGRCVSATHEALASIRVMPPVFAMGHAAGIAAAMATKSGVKVRDIDIKKLQAQIVAEDGVIE